MKSDDEKRAAASGLRRIPVDRTTIMTRTIDISGLSDEAVRTVEILVDLLRAPGQAQSGNHLQTLDRPALNALNQLSPEEWLREWRSFIAAHQVNDVIVDDSRESIYAGCGE